MPEFQLLRCMVALGGDDSTTVYRHRGNPIIFPELIVLQNLHGEEAITDVHVVGTCQMSQEEALIRLHTIYRKEQIDPIFPGARPRLPTSDPTVPFCTLPIYTPKPVRPDNPDPRLRPLDSYTVTEHMPRVHMDAPAPESDPTPEEIAAHTQDDESAGDVELFDEADDTASRPSVEDVPMRRVGYLGKAAQASRTPDHLPDVAHTPRIHKQRDTHRAKG